MEISSAIYIFLDGKKRIDKYGPQDGHPNIVGLHVVHFLQERMKQDELAAFTEIVRNCHFLPYNELKPDARTDKSSDILGLLWRRGAMDLYDSEDYADVVDFDYQIDLDTQTLRILGSHELEFSFEELRTMSDDDYMARVADFS